MPMTGIENEADWDSADDEAAALRPLAVGWDAAGFTVDPEELLSRSLADDREASWEESLGAAMPMPGDSSRPYDETLFDEEDDGNDELLRHDSLAFLCDRFHRMIVGEAAAALLEGNPAKIPARGSLWVAPTWSWVHARINVGRKNRDRESGQELLLPVRVAFRQQPVAVYSEARISKGRSISVNWAATGLGHTGSGTVHLRAGGSPLMLPETPSGVLAEEGTEQGVPWGIPVDVELPLLERDELTRALEQMTREGKQAEWEVIAYFDGHVREALKRAHASVVIELLPHLGDRKTLLDETKMETLATHMLLGDDEHPGYIMPLVARCLKPGFFVRVEPMKYLRDSIRRDANQAIRRAIGDPHIGPKVRRLAAELGTRDLGLLIDVYRQRYPKDRLSEERARAALSVEGDPMASWWSLYVNNDPDDDSDMD